MVWLLGADRPVSDWRWPLRFTISNRRRAEPRVSEQSLTFSRLDIAVMPTRTLNPPLRSKKQFGMIDGFPSQFVSLN